MALAMTSQQQQQQRRRRRRRIEGASSEQRSHGALQEYLERAAR